jgi:hypothetical protein
LANSLGLTSTNNNNNTSNCIITSTGNGIGDVSYSCETASYFYLQHIQSRIEKFHLDIKNIQNDINKDNNNIIYELFPFHNYFYDAPQPLFSSGIYYFL